LIPVTIEFQKRVMQALAIRAGPAASDITRGVCAKMGIAPLALAPADMDTFASLVEAELAGILSASEAKSAAAELRSLK
jgi:hypothetical protein